MKRRPVRKSAPKAKARPRGKAKAKARARTLRRGTGIRAGSLGETRITAYPPTITVASCQGPRPGTGTTGAPLTYVAHNPALLNPDNYTDQSAFARLVAQAVGIEEARIVNTFDATGRLQLAMHDFYHAGLVDSRQQQMNQLVWLAAMCERIARDVYGVR